MMTRTSPTLLLLCLVNALFPEIIELEHLRCPLRHAPLVGDQSKKGVYENCQPLADFQPQMSLLLSSFLFGLGFIFSCSFRRPYFLFEMFLSQAS